jgi:hypothetical protein
VDVERHKSSLPDFSKGTMSRRKQAITTLQDAFAQYFPDAETPEVKHLCQWLTHRTVEQILDIMARVAAHDVLSPLRYPAGKVWEQIKADAKL